jgi:iron complex transport system substrate-binding protein
LRRPCPAGVSRKHEERSASFVTIEIVDEGLKNAKFSKSNRKIPEVRATWPLQASVRLMTVAFAVGMVGASQQASAAPERVVSLNMCTDELVLLLAAPEQIASVTHLSRDRHEFPFWRTALRYWANDGSIASVAGIRPDLIVTMGGLARDRARLAERIGAEILILPFPQTLEDVELAITQVAAALGREARGRSYIEVLRNLEMSRPVAPTEALFLSDGGLSVSSDSLGAQWLSLAGVAVPEDQGGRVTAERMLINPPATIIRSDYRDEQTSRGQFWPGFRFLERSPQTRILFTDGRRWTCSGPSLLPEIMRLREVLAR